MDDQMIESNNNRKEEKGNGLFLLANSTEKIEQIMAQPRYTKGSQRLTDDKENKQQRNKLVTRGANDIENQNSKHPMTSNDSDDDISIESRGEGYSNKKMKPNINYKRGGNRKKENRRENYYEDSDDDDDDANEDDEDINIKTPTTTEEVSPATSEDATNSTRSSYIVHMEETGQAITNGDLQKQVELIVKEHVWKHYKHPDKEDYEYGTKFCNKILLKLNCEVKHMNRRGQEMWTKIMPMVKTEYQITRSSVTQAMKQIFFGKL